MLSPYNKNNINDVILANHINNHYISQFKKNNTSKSIELMLSSTCSFECKYCYYNKYGSILYPSTIVENNILSNLDKLLFYLTKYNLAPKINIFSGEPFDNPFIMDIIEKIIDFHSISGKNQVISIPTGFSFIGDKSKTNQIKDLFKYAKKRGVYLFLSCSIDGKYCDENRPYKSGFIRTDDWYDEMFDFCKEYNVGYHPMVYYNKIENWIDNFNWFQNMFKKHNIKNPNLYLLEVRNDGWDKHTIRHMYKFSKYISTFLIKNNKNVPMQELLYGKNNIDYNWFSIFKPTHNAVTCGLENSLPIRLADMTTYPCHRLQYSEFKGGEFIFDKYNDLKIKSDNIEMFIVSSTAKTSDYPKCQNCDINNICKGQCLGSQYETMNDPFLPILSVCAMIHAQIKGIIDAFYENTNENFINYLPMKMKSQIEKIKEKK